MNTESSAHGRPEPSLDGLAWLSAVMFAVRLYGVVALCYIGMQPAGHRFRFMHSWGLVWALLFGYLLCVALLSGIGLKQLRSGARRKAFLNLGLAALNALFGFCAFYLIYDASNRYL